MEVRFLCPLLPLMVLVSVLSCDAKPLAEDTHLCSYPFNVRKTKLITWKCGRNLNKICTRNKTWYITKTRDACCDGWIRSATEKKCIPDCKRGCTRGTCVAPDVCVCDPPLILKYNTTCEEPQCNPPCVNANCVDDDRCICNEGFASHNATLCIPTCSEGFVNDPNTLECKPKCDECINGYCTAPNTCTCDTGYILDNSTCVPHCNKTCKNGKCVGPDTCECSEGYGIDSLDKSLCNPICDNVCINATCIEPNKCACLEGYENLNSSACKPKCDRCDNGECVAPNQCNCSDGYSKTDGINCTPVCAETCLNGYCSAPNTCTCNEGYEVSKEGKFTCQPVCKDRCINSTCDSPDTCTCYSGYEKLNGSVCRPFCVSCQHGVCVSPNNCQCSEGFNRINGSCQPVCSVPCVNGYCESPEKCTCNEGYIENVTQSTCYKPCTGLCYNGVCNVDGECMCNFEYKLFNNSCIVPDSCDDCNSTCFDGDCWCQDGRPCNLFIDLPPEASASLASLQITWVLGGCVGILLVAIVIVTIGYIWRKRKEYGEKPTDKDTAYPSVLYTIPNTLIHNNYDEDRNDYINEDDEEDTKEVSLHLLEAGKQENEKIEL